MPVRIRAGVMLRAALVVVCTVLLFGGPPDEQRISIYSPVANYSLTVVPREGRNYVGLLELLEPLGSVTAKAEKQTWKLRFNNVDAQFTAGQNRARIHGQDADLPARFLMENDRGLIPVDAVTALLPYFLGFPVLYHPESRRLFIGQSGTTYTTQFNAANPPKLVLNFSAPVNPTIATEPGSLRMVFSRDPLVASGPPTVSFNGKAISSASFEENNGAAIITIGGNAPLMASFGNDGRTITIAPAPSLPPQAAASQPAAPANSPTAAATPPAPPPTGPSAATTLPAARTFALIDASHGGTESGATFSETLIEKDITLALARRIRQELVAKGMVATLVRDSDATMTNDQRAGMTNAMHPAIYIAVHAAADGKGTRIYTALLPAVPLPSAAFVPWEQAQAASLPTSQAVASGLAIEFAKTVSARTLTAPLHPLCNLTVPAIAIEIAPRNGKIDDLSAEDYQQQVAAGIATVLVGMKDKLGAPQ